MLAIVDNGSGADEIARFLRGEKEIVRPDEPVNASGIILSDGNVKNQSANIKIIKKADVPMLAIGSGYLFLGAAYGARSKAVKFNATERVKLVRPCPLTLDLKKVFNVVESCRHGFEEMPENFDVIASSSGYEFEIIQDAEKPFFGVHFNPEKGLDGQKVLDNFAKFVDVWEKYHKV